MLRLFVFQFVFASSQYVSDRRPTVQLKQGTLLGITVYEDGGKSADAFLGIPYAIPPIENLRFAPPKKHLGWNGTLKATDFPLKCPELPISPKNTEDCLYLNVWRPENSLRTGPKSVVIFFEGIEFKKSSGIPIPGQDLSIEDVIVVTINYRMNVFGFLCLGISEARGNFGLLDQYLAILWVKDNIRYFGGDPEKITLFGYSSGAASVILHMTSPRTRGLYQRVVISSGSPLSPWHTSEDPFAASKKLSSVLGCYNKDPKAVVKCLQTKSVNEILSAYQNYVDIGNRESFLPIIDDFLPENDRYLPNSVENALRRNAIQQVPIMIGISRKICDPEFSKWEGLADQGLLQLQQYFDHIKIPEIIKKYDFDSVKKTQVLELLKWRFLSSSHGDVRLLLKQLKNLDFEAKIEAPVYSLLSMLEIGYIGPLYVYYIGDLGININRTDVSITSDLILLFGPLLLNQIGRRRFTSKEYRISAQVKNLVKNFLIFGDPTPMNDNKWKRYASSDYHIETFQTTGFKEDEETIYRNRRISFWLNLLPKVSQTENVFTTSPKEFTNPDPTASFRHALYTLVGLVIALLILLGVCIVLLKKRYEESQRNFHMGY